VNESAFLLFQEASKLAVGPEDLRDETADQCCSRAFEYISRLHRFPRLPLSPISKTGRSEAKVIAARLAHFFAKRHRHFEVKPFFPGCGWVNDAEGDVLSGQILYEVKAGDRQFRLSDMRQLLCYCALDFSAKKYGIETVCLFNPRTGVVIEEDLELLCQKTAGSSSADVLGEIVAYISEPQSRYVEG
jgi:hypothetical protein